MCAREEESEREGGGKAEERGYGRKDVRDKRKKGNRRFMAKRWNFIPLFSLLSLFILSLSLADLILTFG